MSDDITSFIVRFVRAGTEDEPARWRGIINHVQTNAKLNFSRLTEAIEFMQEQVGKEVMEGFADLDPQALAQSAEMWGDMTARYQRLMFDAWGEAFSIPPQIQRTVLQSLNTWGLPNRKDQEASIQALEELSARVDRLTKNVEELERRLAEAKLEEL